MSKADAIRRAAPLILALVEDYESRIKNVDESAHSSASPRMSLVGSEGDLSKRAVS